MAREVVLGIDLGTQGARVLAVSAEGEIAASAQAALPLAAASLPDGWFEQDPRAWWTAVSGCIRAALEQLPAGSAVAGISVDSTSGTILPVDARGEPLSPAIMYNDQRSQPVVARVSVAGAGIQDALGYIFGSSFGLPKIAWVMEYQPDLFAKTVRFIHAADFIVGRLTGDFGVTDSSNALKTGYDPLGDEWPAFIEASLGVPLSKLPRVARTGMLIGAVDGRAAAETGLPGGTPVYAGATDGTAAMIASGASRPGEWNSTLGTTLVLKGNSAELVRDPRGRIYFHRHPDGHWMPGGASNTGTEWIAREHPGRKPGELEPLLAGRIPTGLVRYPLCRVGERFPFVDPAAVGFTLGTPSDEVEAYAAGLEGVAMLERLAYDSMVEIGLPVGPRVYTTGGGSNSRVWSQVRATVLCRTLCQPQTTETAMGAAVIAAAGCWYLSLGEAARRMVRIASTFEPHPGWVEALDEKYRLFRAELQKRGSL